jgi:hypothetical protein
MRKPGLFVALVGVGLLAAVLVAYAAGEPVSVSHQVKDDEGEGDTYLPLVMVQEEVVPTPVPTATPTPTATPQIGQLENGSFEEGWHDLPPAPGSLINQEPREWDLYWVEPGEPLFGSSDTAGGVPECVHKHKDQLPPHEQPGGPDALILDGDYVYKIFHSGEPFGAELSQTVSQLPPGSTWRLTVPIQVHLHGDTDPNGAESGVWVNGTGGWANGDTMGDRNWYQHEVEFTVPANGAVEIVIRVKSKWPQSKDFFIDDVQLVEK